MSTTRRADCSHSLLPKGVQIVLFSATFPEHVVKYATNFAGNANQMTLRHEDLTVEGIKQIYLDCENDADKYDVLVKFYGLLTIGSSIIFVKVSLLSSNLNLLTRSRSADTRDCCGYRKTHDSRRTQGGIPHRWLRGNST